MSTVLSEHLEFMRVTSSHLSARFIRCQLNKLTLNQKDIVTDAIVIKSILVDDSICRPIDTF